MNTPLLLVNDLEVKMNTPVWRGLAQTGVFNSIKICVISQKTAHLGGFSYFYELFEAVFFGLKKSLGEFWDTKAHSNRMYRLVGKLLYGIMFPTYCCDY